MLSPVDVQVGQYYDVPCVTNEWNKEIPVLLPYHTDGKEDCLTEVPEHFHIDFRFCSFYEFGSPAWEAKLCSVPFLKQKKAIASYVNSFTISGESAFFFWSNWHKKFNNSKLKEGRCPHKNVQVVNACGTCPAHGLQWNLETKKLADFKLPFYLELANNQIPNPNNPRGEVLEDSCTILIEQEFNHDGCVIMVDSLGNRYGQAFQKIDVIKHKPGNSVFFDAKKLCKAKIA